MDDLDKIKQIINSYYSKQPKTVNNENIYDMLSILINNNDIEPDSYQQLFSKPSLTTQGGCAKQYKFNFNF